MLHSENLNAVVLINRMPRMFLVLLIVIPIKMLWCHRYFILPKLQKCRLLLFYQYHTEKEVSATLSTALDRANERNAELTALLEKERRKNAGEVEETAYPKQQPQDEKKDESNSRKMLREGDSI